MKLNSACDISTINLNNVWAGAIITELTKKEKYIKNPDKIKKQKGRGV